MVMDHLHGYGSGDEVEPCLDSRLSAYAFDCSQAMNQLPEQPQLLDWIDLGADHTDFSPRAHYSLLPV